MNFRLSYYDIPIIVFSLIGFYLFYKTSKYIYNQLKLGLDSDKKRVGKYLSRTVFALMVSISILFIGGLIISTVAINLIYGIQEIKLVFIDGVVKPWQFEEVLPVIFVAMLGFIALYPLVEFISLAKKDKRIPTEIHGVLARIINVTKTPIRYLIAVLLYVIIVWVPPYLLWELAKFVDIRANWGYIFSELTLFGLIFFAFNTLGPILYLAYYENISKASFITRGRQYKKAKNYKVGIKMKVFVNFLVVIAIITLISSVYRLAVNFPALWGQAPEQTTSYLDLDGGIIEAAVDAIVHMMNLSQEYLNAYGLIKAILPLDFILFFISTIGFGVLGFYTKFWSKEKLNRTQIIWFAAYLICGLSFEIFFEVLLKWPWVLPDLGVLEMSDATFQRITTFFFGPTYVFVQIFMVGYFIYHAFFNKKLESTVGVEIQEYLIRRDEKRALKITKRLKKKEEKRAKKKEKT